MITNDIGEEVMTVAELIKELEQIKDKNSIICADFDGYLYNANGSYIKDHNFIINYNYR